MPSANEDEEEEYVPSEVDEGEPPAVEWGRPWTPPPRRTRLGSRGQRTVGMPMTQSPLPIWARRLCVTPSLFPVSTTRVFPRSWSVLPLTIAYGQVFEYQVLTVEGENRGPRLTTCDLKMVLTEQFVEYARASARALAEAE